jgi:transposase-like protein
MCQNSRSVGTASLAWRDDPGVSMKPTSKSEVAGPNLYRAVDKEGKTVDFLLRAKRDVAAAKAFFRKAFRVQNGLPHKITLDGYQASHRAAKEALGEHPKANQCKIRSSKYLTDVSDKAFPNPHGG